MKFLALVRRNLAYHWRTNLAVLLGCIVGASTLTGALLVGDSMRGSLRAMTLERLGAIDHVAVGDLFFTQEVADRLPYRGESGSATAVLMLRGSASGPENGHAYHVNVIGTTPAIWRMFPTDGIPGGEADALPKRVVANAALAEQLQMNAGQELVLNLEKASNAHREDVLGERDETRIIRRYTLDYVLPTRNAGRFSLEASQQIPLNLYVPIEILAKAIEQPGRANALLIAGGGKQPVEKVDADLTAAFRLADYGLSILTDKDTGAYWIESRRLTLDPKVSKAAKEAAEALGEHPTPILAQLATEVRKGRLSFPYAIVAAVGEPALPGIPSVPKGGIALNLWAAARIGAAVGDEVRLQYFEVQKDGSLATRIHPLKVSAITKIEGAGADRHFAPTYPGLTDAADFAKMKAPFLIRQELIKPQDEDYWKKHRTAPKAFVSLADGQVLWKSRFGDLTGLRVARPARKPSDDFGQRWEQEILKRLKPADVGLVVQPVKQQDLEASSGSTPFDVLFLSFSFFLIVSAALLVGLLFRLNTERRANEVGLLLAVGLDPARVQRLLLVEGLVLSAVGAVVGMFGAVVYARTMLAGLTGRWRDAVQTPFIEFHWSAQSMLIGAAASILVGLVAIWWALRGLKQAAAAMLLSKGFTFSSSPSRGKRRLWTVVAIVCGVAGAALPFAVSRENVGAFFGSGALLLVAALSAFAASLGGRGDLLARGAGSTGLTRLGVRNAGRHPVRSVLTVALLAFAAFLVVAVAAFRHGDDDRPPERNSGDGGFSLMAESSTPLYATPSVKAAERLSLSPKTADLLTGVKGYSLRLHSGDDASCLNVYQPRKPTLIGATDEFIDRGGFAFAKLASDASDDEKANPWRLLRRKLKDDEVAAIGDQETIDYILKSSIGGTLPATDESGRPFKLKLVAGLAGSIFQGQILVSEEALLAKHPGSSGYRFFLFDTSAAKSHDDRELGASLETDLVDSGFDVTATSRRLATYRAVANTYIATFQTLGAFGLLLGTLGLSAVLLRNVLERRGELALLRAVGFADRPLGMMIFAENAYLLLIGVAAGTACAVVAILPQLLTQHGAPDLSPLAGMLLAVIGVGLGSGSIATVAALRTPLIPALRSE